jgi:hypothetical protein
VLGGYYPAPLLKSRTNFFRIGVPDGFRIGVPDGFRIGVPDGFRIA